ncbi:HAD-like domain-containing protein [Scenedesmus sp. NREL 46B-D3]|nr:HAD-like domain-containing protein [Scenedesmus sp. NREL 46B-D3]
MAACAVAKGLYVGSQAALDQVQELSITHVLSVVNYEVAPPEGTCHWAVQLEDAEAANLLAELPAAVAWLERALRQKGSKVLVHCNAGTSRSPSVVAAAIMKAKGLALDEALAVLRARAPHASPNPGFMAQLELWGEMGCCVDEDHPVYKQFMLDQVARQWEEEGYVDPASFAELLQDEAQLVRLVRYRCRKCRQLLATERNVIPTAGVGRRTFRRQRYSQLQQQEEQAVPDAAEQQGSVGGLEQGSVFTEPLAWMCGQVVGPVQGKLYCPNCQARLGSFNWAGISNSAGSWMVPGFQLHSSRLDQLCPKPPAALAGMRFPAALTAHKQHAGQQQQHSGPAGVGLGDGQPPPPPQQQQQQVDFLLDLPEQNTPPPPQQQQQQDGCCDQPGRCQPAASCCEQQQTVDGLQQLTLQQQQQQQQPWFRFLVLDCDGVLVDTEAASCESLRRAVLQVTGVDIPHVFPSDFTAVFGMDVRGCIEHYKQTLGRDDWQDVPAIAAAVAEAKEGHYQQLTAAGITALPGAAALIQSAKQLGLPVGVASSGAPSKIQHNLSSSGLITLLPNQEFIVSAAEVPAGKPAPDVYLEVLRRMGCEDASRALVVEDAVHGLVAATAAGTFAVGVTNSLPAEVLSQHADLVVATLEQLDLASMRGQQQQQQ